MRKNSKGKTSRKNQRCVHPSAFVGINVDIQKGLSLIALSIIKLCIETLFLHCVPGVFFFNFLLIPSHFNFFTRSSPSSSRKLASFHLRLFRHSIFYFACPFVIGRGLKQLIFRCCTKKKQLSTKRKKTEKKKHTIFHSYIYRIQSITHI